MQYQVLFIKKQRLWMKKWKVNQNSAVKEVKEILIQKGLSHKGSGNKEGNKGNKDSEQTITSGKERRRRSEL